MMNTTSNQYHHNHYVPVWYQRKFLRDDQSQFFYLDKAPETRSQNGRTWVRNNLLRWGPDNCFAQDDLYTMQWGSIENTDIEQFFFGKIDSAGKMAVEHFENFELNEKSNAAFSALLSYMSVQKLRTPKGLGNAREVSRIQNKSISLLLLQRMQNIFCAIWTECIWQIAEASQSKTKFIISDHPVTVYNRECFPESKWCLGFNDPDIRQVATHTFFPFSLNKVLILTNLAWVRDPYQNPLTLRPNPNFFRNAIFNFQDIQFDRFLSEEEVVQINYVIKSRALRYVAAAEREWLFPEKYLTCDQWRKLGNGYLLMPDPRHVFGGGQTVIGYKDGSSDAYSEYGHRPWQYGYKDDERERREWQSLNRFKSEWSAAFGRKYRGLSRHFNGRSRIDEESQDIHEHHLEKDSEWRKKPGERQRRRKLRQA